MIDYFLTDQSTLMQGWIIFWLLCTFIYQMIRLCHQKWTGATLPAWCQGCDQLQPSASMKFTEIGLYRCGVCRDPDRVIHPKHSTDIADNLSCTCLTCRSRVKMQALGRGCTNCHCPASYEAYGRYWCEQCMNAHHTQKTHASAIHIKTGTGYK